MSLFLYQNVGKSNLKTFTQNTTTWESSSIKISGKMYKLNGYGTVFAHNWYTCF